MLAFIVSALASRLALPPGAIKALLAAAAFAVVVLIGVGAAWQLRLYAEHQTDRAVAGAEATVAAKVDGAALAAARADADAQARAMAGLEKDELGEAAMWDAATTTLDAVKENPADVSPVPAPPQVLDPLPPVGPFLPAGGRELRADHARSLPAPVRPLRAAAPVRPRAAGLDDLVAADRGADRLLERATAP